MGGADYIQFDTDGNNACGTGTPANPNTYSDGKSNGSIYLDGTLTLTNDASICSHQDFNSTGTTCTIPTTGATIPNVFWSIFNRSNTVPAFTMPGNSKFESSAFVNGQYSLTNGGSASSVGGSIFANYASITGGSSFAVTNVVPTGSIGSATTTTGLERRAAHVAAVPDHRLHMTFRARLNLVRSEQGMGLIELLIALTILVIGIARNDRRLHELADGPQAFEQGGHGDLARRPPARVVSRDAVQLPPDHDLLDGSCGLPDAERLPESVFGAPRRRRAPSRPITARIIVTTALSNPTTGTLQVTVTVKQSGSTTAMATETSYFSSNGTSGTRLGRAPVEPAQ